MRSIDFSVIYVKLENFGETKALFMTERKINSINEWKGQKKENDILTTFNKDDTVIRSEDQQTNTGKHVHMQTFLDFIIALFMFLW